MEQKSPALAPILVSVKDAAALLGVCPRTVQNYVALKELPLRKIGRRSLIPYAALQAFARKDHESSMTPAEVMQ